MKKFRVGQKVSRRKRHYDWIGCADPFTIEEILRPTVDHYSLKFEGIEGYYHGQSFNVVEEPNTLPEELFTI